MYKDDSIIGSCNDSLLRMMIEGKGNSAECPNTPDRCSINDHNRSWGLVGYPLASVFAPLQEFDELYDLQTALDHGTVFVQLDLPFMGDRRVSKGGSCRG